MNNPRTSPNQAIPSRPARSKNAIKSRRSVFSTRGASTIPGYVRSMYPTVDRKTARAMANAIERYEFDTGHMPTPDMCRIHLFVGLIDEDN